MIVKKLIKIDPHKIKDRDKEIELSFSNWHNKLLSSKINKPIDGNFKQNKLIKINFGNALFESKFCKHYEYNVRTNLFCFNKFEPFMDKNDEKKIKTIDIQINKIKLIPTPFLPHRPLLPMRCKYVCTHFGISKLITILTC